jgi:hypothetical protein
MFSHHLLRTRLQPGAVPQINVRQIQAHHAAALGLQHRGHSRPNPAAMAGDHRHAAVKPG